MSQGPRGAGVDEATATHDEHGKAEEARGQLARIVRLMGVEAEVTITEEAERVVLDVQGPETGLIIGKKGQTLDALQYLVNKMVNRDREGRRAVVVDAEGYRGRREEALVELAQRLGAKAIRSGRVVAVNPMCAHDRRIIHMTLSNVQGVTTRSEGEGSFRRLMIVPDDRKV